MADGKQASFFFSTRSAKGDNAKFIIILNPKNIISDLSEPHLNQGNLRKRKNSLQNHTATATVSSEGNAFLQPIVPQHHEKRFQQNQFEKRQMFAAQSAQVAVPPASRRVQALAPPTQVAAPPLQVPSQMQLQQQQQPVPVLYRTPTLAAPRNTQVFNAPRNTQVFDAPRNTQVFDAPRNTQVFDAPRNTQVFDAPRNTQVFEAPRNTQVFEAPRNTQVFEAPRNTQVFEAPRNTQVFEAPIPVDVAKPEPVQKPRPRQKPRFVVRDHHLSVMSNLSALWQKRKLCDAGIGNGTSTVMVHKVVLSAVCPKLLSVFSTDILSQKFLQVNFPEEVSTEALNAFAEYMYNGILDLDVEILKQLKIIAKRLDMKEFEELCDRHLPYVFHQSAVGPFTNLPLIETSVSFPAMTSSHASLDSSISMNGAPSVMTQVIDINHEISEAELDQVKKDTAALFGQESDVTSLALNRSGNTAGFVIYPSIKTEPVGPEDNKYGYLSNNQVFTPTISPSSSSLATAATPSYTSIPSISTSSIEFSIPSSQSTDVKSTRLKPTHSYKIPLVSDLCPISRIDETVYSKSSAIKENSSLQLSRQPISTSSIQLPSTSTNNEGIYPLGLFTVKRDNPALLTTETFNVKTDLT